MIEYDWRRWLKKMSEKDAWRTWVMRVIEEDSWRRWLKKMLGEDDWRIWLKKMVQEYDWMIYLMRLADIDCWRGWWMRMVDEDGWWGWLVDSNNCSIFRSPVELWNRWSTPATITTTSNENRWNKQFNHWINIIINRNNFWNKLMVFWKCEDGWRKQSTIYMICEDGRWG